MMLRVIYYYFIKIEVIAFWHVSRVTTHYISRELNMLHFSLIKHLCSIADPSLGSLDYGAQGPLEGLDMHWLCSLPFWRDGRTCIPPGASWGIWVFLVGFYGLVVPILNRGPLRTLTLTLTMIPFYFMCLDVFSQLLDIAMYY